MSDAGARGFFSRLTDAARADPQEFEQAKLRLVMTSAWVAYFIALLWWDGALGRMERVVIAYLLPFWALGFAHFAWIVRRPGRNGLRRMLGIVLDLSNCTVAMVLLGEPAAILFLTYPWVVIGNGFRFGRLYLHVAQALALAGFAVVAFASPFWRNYPTLDVTLGFVLTAVPSYVGVLISRLESARRRIEEARGEAEAANLAKTRFLAAASHDLRQPMQALSLYASVLGQPLPQRESLRILQGIQLSVQTLERMFDSLLDIARIESGVVQPQIAAFALRPVLERIADAERPLAAQKGIDLRVVPTSAVVRSDPLLLERILKNLVTNAIRYTECGRIVLGCRRVGGHGVRIEVADSGIGIPAHEQQRIFEEYYQIDGESTQGLGLGLPIVKSLAELLGHRVGLKSRPGRGSRFSIELERARPEERRAAAPHAAAAELAGITVALVDDDIEIRRSMSLLLESWGCRCVAGATGGEVEGKLEAARLRPDALVVDYRLAEAMNGLRVVERLRSAFGAGLPALLITGTPNAALLAHAGAGVSIAAKPVPPGRLRAFLSSSRG